MPEFMSVSPLSRRSFMKVAGVAALSASAVTVTGCGKEEATPTPETGSEQQAPSVAELSNDEKYEALAVLALVQALTDRFYSGDFVLGETTYKVTSIVSERCKSMYYDKQQGKYRLGVTAEDGTSVYGKFTLYDKYSDVVKGLRPNEGGWLDTGYGAQFHCFLPKLESSNQYIELAGRAYRISVSL